MSKDLTKLSRKELESKLAKKYGVDKYLNQRSQLIDLLSNKGETDIQSGFTGPETEALSIMLENIMTSNKAGGGVVALLGGGPVIGNPNNTRNGILGLWTGSAESANAGAAASEEAGGGDDPTGNTSGKDSGDDPTGNTDGRGGGVGNQFGGFDPQDDEDSARGGDYSINEDNIFTGYGKSKDKSIEDLVKSNPQLKGFLGKEIDNLIDKGKVQDFEFNKKGELTGVVSRSNLPGTLGAVAGLLGLPTNTTTYTGYGKGADLGPDLSSESSEVKKIIRDEEKKEEEDSPLTQAEIDYYTRGMGLGTKSLKSLKDINDYMASLVGTTKSPTGAKLSKDKRFLILPNGKIINLRTGKVQKNMSGLELFSGGLI